MKKQLYFLFVMLCTALVSLAQTPGFGDGSAASPYSVDRVYELLLDSELSSTDSIYVTGKVTYTQVNGTQSYIALSNDCPFGNSGSYIYIYDILSATGDGLQDGDLHLGDSVVIKCLYDSYRWRFDSNCPLVYHEQISPAISLSSDQTVFYEKAGIMFNTNADGVYYSFNTYNYTQWNGDTVWMNYSNTLYFMAYNMVNGCPRCGEIQHVNIAVLNGKGTGTADDPFDVVNVVDFSNANIDSVSIKYAEGYLEQAVTYDGINRFYLTSPCNYYSIICNNIRKADGSLLTPDEVTKGTHFVIKGRFSYNSNILNNWEIVAMEISPKLEMTTQPENDGRFFDSPAKVSFKPLPEGYSLFYSINGWSNLTPNSYDAVLWHNGDSISITESSTIQAIIAKSVAPCEDGQTNAWALGESINTKLYVGLAGHGQGTIDNPFDIERANDFGQKAYYEDSVCVMGTYNGNCDNSHFELQSCTNESTLYVYPYSGRFDINSLQAGELVKIVGSISNYDVIKLCYNYPQVPIVDRYTQTVGISTNRPLDNLLEGDSIIVKLHAPTATTILYTTDGTNPMANGIAYADSIVLKATTNLRAVAAKSVNGCLVYGPVASKNYKFDTPEVLSTIQYTYNRHTYTLHVDTSKVMVGFEPIPLGQRHYEEDELAEIGGLSDNEGYVLLHLSGSDEYTYDSIYSYNQQLHAPITPKYEYRISMDGEDITNRGVYSLNFGRTTQVAIREIAHDHDITIHRVRFEGALGNDSVKVALRLNTPERDDYDIYMYLTDDYSADPTTVVRRDSAMVKRGANASLYVNYGAMLGRHYRIRINGVDVTNESSGELFNGDYCQYWTLHNIQSDAIIEVDQLYSFGEQATWTSNHADKARLVMRNDEGDMVPFVSGDTINGLGGMLYIELAPGYLLSNQSDFHGYFRGGLHWHYVIDNAIEYTDYETGKSYISLYELANNPMSDNMLQLTAAEFTLHAIEAVSITFMADSLVWGNTYYSIEGIQEWGGARWFKQNDVFSVAKGQDLRVFMQPDPNQGEIQGVTVNGVRHTVGTAEYEWGEELPYVDIVNPQNHMLFVVWYGQSNEITEEVTEVSVNVSDNNATITWPAVLNTVKYVIKVYKEGELFVTITFLSNGAVESMVFTDITPSSTAHRVRQRAQQQANEVSGGWQYTIFGLDPNAEYTYNITCYDSNEAVITTTIPTMSGSFETQSAPSVPTGYDNLDADAQPVKFIQDGKLFIRQGNNIFDATGRNVNKE